jgi:L-asparaginase II
MTVTTPQPVTVHVPDNAFAGDSPIVAVMRGEAVGSLHRGTFALVDSEGTVELALGDIDQPVYLRSAAKLFQVMPAILAGALDRFSIEERELAVLCASHSAEPRHTDAVLSVLNKLGLDQQALHCGVHPPLNEAAARTLICAGEQPTPVHNNCSGAHTGMLAACVARGWPLDTYGQPDHPLQLEIRRILAAFSGLTADAIGVAVDNCHVPTFQLPVRHAAQAFARLVSGSDLPADLAASASTVVQAMTQHPEMVAGEDRFDTDLMRAAAGHLVAKGGAEAFQGIGLIDARAGLAMKISDGNPRAIGPAALALLDHLVILDSDKLKTLEAYRRPAVLDLQGQVVGHLTPVFHLGTAS